MANYYHQLSLKDTFSDCKDMFIYDVPSFFQLLEQHFDISLFIPLTFYHAFYQHLGSKRDYPLTAFLSALILQKIFPIPTDSLLILLLHLCKELREFADYCAQNAIQIYSPDTGLIYFLQRYGLDMADSAVKLTEQQRATRRTIRFLDDIYQFGCARRNSHHDYKVPPRYADVLENYLNHCIKNNGASGTIDVKRTKLKQFLCYLDGRGILLPDITASDVSDYMTTLCQYKRATIHIISSVLKDFFRYLHTSGILKNNLAGDVPRPKIYVEESFPETWTPEEIQQLLSVINRRTAIGKRDYAMILVAVRLGMRAGDICA